MKKNVCYVAILCAGLAVASCGSCRKVHGCTYPDLKENANIQASGMEINRGSE